MSTCCEKDSICPRCKAKICTTFWPGISGDKDTHLRSLVLEETLFLWKCPLCSYEMEALCPSLYHDREHGFVIALSPFGLDVDIDLEAMKLPENTIRRLVRSSSELKEKILILEQGFNDAAIELAKIAVLKQLEERGYTVRRAYFSSADRVEKTLTFSFLTSDEKEPLVETTKLALYKNTLKMVNSMGFKMKSDSFLSVNLETATTMLKIVQNRQKKQE